MTADIELLPSSVAAFTEALKGERGSLDAWLEVNDEREVAAHVEAYTRANVAHATAAKDAEIERLRAERDSFQRVGIREQDRAERLAEALRLALKWAEVLPAGEPLRAESVRDLDTARAALRDHDQEGKDG